MSLLVSIVIPAYNSEKWIERTIISALHQTWERKEIIIVDDGSNDKTVNIARKYESKILRVLTQENKGASAARNTGLKIAQGDYFQWLDSDDVLARDKISNQLKTKDVGRTSRILLTSKWGIFSSDVAKAKFIPSSLWQNLSPLDHLIIKMDENAYMATGSWLVSRELTELAGPWNEQLLRDNDGEYFKRVILSSEEVRFVPESIIYWRKGNIRSISSNANLTDEKIESLFIATAGYVKTLLSLENSERTRKVCIKFLQRWLIYFYPDKTEILKKLYDLAAELGETLQEPELDWKYSLIQKTFGWKFAKKARIFLPIVKSRALGYINSDS